MFIIWESDLLFSIFQELKKKRHVPFILLTFIHWRPIHWIPGHIPEVAHVPFALSISDGLVLPQLLQQLRLSLAAVRQGGGSSRCGCYQFRVQGFTGKHHAEWISEWRETKASDILPRQGCKINVTFYKHKLRVKPLPFPLHIWWSLLRHLLKHTDGALHSGWL